MTFGSRATRCLIGVNGREIAATAILMYPEPIVRAWQGLMANAQAELGSSSGVAVGFLGSAEWALGGAALMGILNAASSNAKAKKAVAYLKDAEAKRDEMMAGATFVDVGSIANIQLPDPSVWIGQRAGQTEVRMKDVDLFKRGSFLRSHGLSKENVRGGKVSVASTDRLVRVENNFVALNTAEGEVSIRWSMVASYRIAA
ncbi:MAG: hypothetical protein JWO65_2254 [Sphingomonas bacterium]|nr:hypothetical protein [Sphingomonas bacterium]